MEQPADQTTQQLRAEWVRAVSFIITALGMIVMAFVRYRRNTVWWMAGLMITLVGVIGLLGSASTLEPSRALFRSLFRLRPAEAMEFLVELNRIPPIWALCTELHGYSQPCSARWGGAASRPRYRSPAYDVTQAMSTLAGPAGDCERIVDGMLNQPVNTISSLAFVVAGVVVLVLVRRQHSMEAPDVLIAGMLILTGFGSAAFHGSRGARRYLGS